MIVKYQAINRQGAMIADSLAVDDPAQAQAELTRLGLTPVRIQEAGSSSASASSASPLAFLHRSKTAQPDRASRRQLPFFTAQLSILLETGTTVAASLAAIQRQIACPHWQALIAGLHRHVEEGGSLASAVETYPKVFDPIYSSMISAGEASGTLSEIFRRLADLAGQSDRIRAKVISAMIYPALLTTIACAVLTVLIFFVLPRFEALFEEMNVNLPSSTKFFMSLSHFVRAHVVIVLISLVTSVTAVTFWARSQSGRRLLRTIVLKVPIIGTLIGDLIIARIFRVIGLLINSNVSLVESLELSGASTKHHLYAALVDRMRQSVLQGRAMYEILHNSRLVPASLAQIVHTGEENGQIGKVMSMLADHLDDRNDTKVQTLTSVMEPLILVFMGIIIGIVAISLVLPMFDLSQITA